MIKGIGIDICQISRMKVDMNRRILSDKENIIYQNIKLEKRKMEFLAGRFAAKEAIYKALSGIKSKILMRDLTIIYDDFGRPYLDQPKWEDIHVHLSISHEKDYAIAQAIAEALEK